MPMLPDPLLELLLELQRRWRRWWLLRLRCFFGQHEEEDEDDEQEDDDEDEDSERQLDLELDEPSRMELEELDGSRLLLLVTEQCFRLQ